VTATQSTTTTSTVTTTPLRRSRSPAQANIVTGFSR
jgi:hypothetical protein